MLEEENKVENIEIDNNVDIQPEKPAKKPLHWGKRLALFLVGFVGIQILGFLVGLVMILVVGTDAAKEDWANGVMNFTIYGILFAILLAILNKDIVKLFDSFKKWKSYLIGLAFAVATIVIPILYDLFVNLFYEVGVNENEEGLRSFIVIYPWMSLFILGFIGPICEELTYRVGLFGLLKRWKWLAYIVSALVFAFMHFSFDAEGDAMIVELINLPMYIFSGVMFALAYDKFGLSASLTAHIVNNVFAVSMTLIETL